MLRSTDGSLPPTRASEQLRTGRQRQTRRETGTQSHGTGAFHASSPGYRSQSETDTEGSHSPRALDVRQEVPVRAMTNATTVGRRAFGAAIEAVLIVAVLLTLAFGTALATGGDSPVTGDAVFAGRGGHGGGGGKPGGGSSATLVVTPSTVAVGGSFTVTGSGFPGGKLVAVAWANPGCCVSFNVAADSSGNISFTRTAGFAGNHTLRAYQYGTTKLLGSTSFVVQ